MGKAYENALMSSELLKPQLEKKGFYHTYYTFSAKFNGDKHGIRWEDFRKKYIEFGGDGIYAASKLQHQEPIFRDKGIGYGETPIAIKLQKKLMNFTTNQAGSEEREIQIDALRQTLKYYGDVES